MQQRFYTSLSDKIYNRLIADIISGEIPAGEKLGEEAISEKMKVSRTPVREAIHRLTQEGVTERIPRCGCFVKQQNFNELKEVFECRRLMECYALDDGFKSISEKHLKKIIKIKNQIEENNSLDQMELSLQLDDELHSLIVEICPNRIMKDMILKLQQQSNPLRIFRSLDKDSIAKITAERIELVNAIIAGDREKAVQLLDYHISLPFCSNETK